MSEAVTRYVWPAHQHPLGCSIPWAWGNALKRLHGLFPEAFIAGGALRDLYFKDAEINDIDIFVRSHGKDTHDDLERALGSDLRAMIEVGEPSEYETWTSSVRGIYNTALVVPSESGPRFEDALLPTGPELQIIALEYDPAFGSADHFEFAREFRDWVIDDFDIGLSQIAFDGYDITMTEAFYSDIRNHTITLIREHTKERSLKRMARLSGKLGVAIRPVSVAEEIASAVVDGAMEDVF